MAEITLRNGDKIPLGCILRTAAPGTLFPRLGDRMPVIPRAQWKPYSMLAYKGEIWSQLQTSSCNAHSSVKCLDVTRRMEGLETADLSPWCLYWQICGGRDAGSMLGDAIKALAQNGTTTRKLFPKMVLRGAGPSGWVEEAANYRATEWWDCATFDELATALQMGFPVNLGVLVGGAFMDVDGDGWVHDYATTRNDGGHAMCGVGLEERKGKWGIRIVNSWGTGTWTPDGTGVLPESYFKVAPFNDAWALRVTTWSKAA